MICSAREIEPAFRFLHGERIALLVETVRRHRHRRRTTVRDAFEFETLLIERCQDIAPARNAAQRRAFDDAAMCCAGPIGKPATTGNAAKIAMSQARPATTTLTPAAKARWKALIPICPTRLAAASTSVASSVGIPSIGTTPFDGEARL